MWAISVHYEGFDVVQERLSRVPVRVESLKAVLGAALHGKLREHFRANSPEGAPGRSGKATRRERRLGNDGRPFRPITVSDAVIAGDQIRVTASTPMIREESAGYRLEKAGIRVSSKRTRRVMIQSGRFPQSQRWGFKAGNSPDFARRGLPALPNVTRLSELLRARAADVLNAGGGL